MKIVINTCYGGFSLPRDFCDTYGIDSIYDDDIERTDPRLVSYVERRGGVVECNCAKLRVVELPDTCTDWELNEYDGFEEIIFVADGKLHHI